MKKYRGTTKAEDETGIGYAIRIDDEIIPVIIARADVENEKTLISLLERLLKI